MADRVNYTNGKDMPIDALKNSFISVRINENLFFFSLERSSKEWADKIECSISNHLKEEGFNNIFKSIYNINESARQLRKIYEREK